MMKINPLYLHSATQMTELQNSMEKAQAIAVARGLVATNNPRQVEFSKVVKPYADICSPGALNRRADELRQIEKSRTLCAGR